MKATKKIVGATCALVAAVALSAGSTFAWFSANKSVKATGMTVTAQADNVWLVIQEGSTFNSSTITTEITSTHAEAKLYPVAPAVTLTSDNVATASSWHYAYSKATDSSVKEGEYIKCTTLSGYTVSETFSIGLSSKSGASSASNLKLTGATLPPDTGISIVVVCGSYIITYKSTDASLPESTKLADSVTTSGTTVTVYYFINGDDTNVYTDNLAALTGSVKLTFGVD
ncbi:MAG: hypothetical protein ACI4MH_02825 [Candidatus Coproplasma sp.]